MKLSTRLFATIAIVCLFAGCAFGVPVERNSSIVYFGTNIYLHDATTTPVHVRIQAMTAMNEWTNGMDVVTNHTEETVTLYIQREGLQARLGIYDPMSAMYTIYPTNNVIRGFYAGEQTNDLWNGMTGIWVGGTDETLSNICQNGNSYTGEISVLRVTGPNANIGLSMDSLKDSKSNEYNIAIGNLAMYNSSGLLYNVAGGYTAMAAAERCEHNTAFGSGAMSGTVDSDANSVYGYEAMQIASNCTENGAVGSYAMHGASGAGYNIAIGYYSMGWVTNCTANSAVGHYALNHGLNAQDNGAYGYYPMYYGTSISNSTAIGGFAGRNATGRGMWYAATYTNDPGASHNPTNDDIFIDNGTVNIGRAGALASGKVNAMRGDWVVDKISFGTTNRALYCVGTNLYFYASGVVQKVTMSAP